MNTEINLKKLDARKIQGYITKHKLENLIEALENVKVNQIDDTYGICFNIDKVLNDSWNTPKNTYEIIPIIATYWSKSSSYQGKPKSYPLPTNYDYGTWEGENLETRIEFIDFMIEVLKTVKEF